MVQSLSTTSLEFASRVRTQIRSHFFPYLSRSYNIESDRKSRYNSLLCSGVKLRLAFQRHNGTDMFFVLSSSKMKTQNFKKNIGALRHEDIHYLLWQELKLKKSLRAVAHAFVFLYAKWTISADLMTVKKTSCLQNISFFYTFWLKWRISIGNVLMHSFLILPKFAFRELIRKSSHPVQMVK